METSLTPGGVLPALSAPQAADSGGRSDCLERLGEGEIVLASQVDQDEGEPMSSSKANP